jgi:hypothetical protein
MEGLAYHGTCCQDVLSARQILSRSEGEWQEGCREYFARAEYGSIEPWEAHARAPRVCWILSSGVVSIQEVVNIRPKCSRGLILVPPRDTQDTFLLPCISFAILIYEVAGN